jgi:hypothetical protein
MNNARLWFARLVTAIYGLARPARLVNCLIILVLFNAPAPAAA